MLTAMMMQEEARLLLYAGQDATDEGGSATAARH
jgi:hypothetical protein